MKEYWTSIEDLEPQEEASEKPKRHGFSDVLEVGASNRRDFLKFFGFSVASAAVIAGCQRPVNKAIPLLVQPEEVSPGIANYYASTFYDGNEPVGIVVKVRDGRPIKVEGNDLSSLTLGGTSAKVQASLLNLYDESRPVSAMHKGETVNWESVLADIANQLQSLNGQGEVTLLTPTVIQPEVAQVISQLKIRYANLVHIQYDAVSYSALRDAHKLASGNAKLPSFELQNADILVAFNADFLGTWLEPVRFTKQYIKRRKLSDGEKSMSQHIHFESTMTLTGSNADVRVPIKPSEEGMMLVALYNALLQQAGASPVADVAISDEIQKTANLLWANRGKGLVLSGANDVNIQTIVIAINQLVGAYGKTIDTTKNINLVQGDDLAFGDWLKRLDDKKIKGVLFYQVNPLYNHPLQLKIEEGLKNVSLKIAITGQQDETSLACDYVLGTHHFLEGWNHYEPMTGVHLLAQPTINPLFDTMQPEEVLMRLAGMPGSYYDLIKSNVANTLSSNAKAFASANSFWDQALHDGFIGSEQTSAITISLTQAEIAKAANKASTTDVSAGGFELYLYRNVAMDDGHWANNPWLQELPDPVSKVCWDNYLAVSPFDAKLRGWNNGDLVKFAGVELAILVQPGQARNTLALALGYGRRAAGTVATGVGANGFPMATLTNGYRRYVGTVSDVQLTGSTYELAATQSHHSMEKRPIVRETNLDKYLDNPASGNEMHAEVEKHLVTLYEQHVYRGHHWAMVIDLNSCIGCNACVVACSAENNVPVVGRNEVRRAHEMHWIRIDRYYAGDAENPQVVRQPVMCQHCDNAPCENVCPVAATNHSSEGLNQMAYNRCIGTRYCNNNCPYKVRRFNWFDYNGADAIPGNTLDVAGMTVDLKRMVLNPDVTVRAKGVIEKCSFCVQRIQEKKLEAKSDGEPLKDGAIQTACQQACPANAIVFGDLNDENSRVAQLMKEARRYHLLEEIKTLPSVAYLTKVRNIDKTFN